MKKLLSILATVGLTATAASTVVACGEKEPELGKLSQKELQEKLEAFFKLEKELQEKLEKATEGTPEYLKIKDELTKNQIETYIFVMGIFLETKYSVDFVGEGTKIVEEKDEEIYHLILEKTIVSYKELLRAWKKGDSEWTDKYREYINRFNECLMKLEKKAGIEDLSKLNVNQLNEKISPFSEEMLGLIKENEKLNEEDGTDYLTPSDNPKLEKQWTKNYFNLYCFLARVFLETEYAVVDIKSDKVEVKEVTDKEEYQELLDTLVVILKDMDALKENEHYLYIFNLYAWELSTKDQLN